MKKLMQILLLRLFGHKPKIEVLTPITQFKTTLPTRKPSFEQWVKEFNVSMLWDRKIVNID